jgi:hypothetical protein
VRYQFEACPSKRFDLPPMTNLHLPCSPSAPLSDLSSTPPRVDWKKLATLGVDPTEAQSIAQVLMTKQLMGTYWRKLIQAGVPKDDAKRIARAIAKYDVSRRPPRSYQRSLIQHYCPFVCRCGLWRSALLLNPS